jgi:eukaryotic-like serine/threonine-protein kinase
LTPERWAQIEVLFHRALECEPEHRDGLLGEACSDDPELRREVEVLLSSQESAADDLQAVVNNAMDVIGFPLAGETVSHYRILNGLAEGGMGLVYRAEDIKLGRQVALKFLPEHSATDPAALGRFEREARSASALEHPNICPIYEFGEHEGRPFIVMQLLEGQTLRELIAATSPGKPPLGIEKLLELAIQIVDGLDAAHQRGIIHRDIKPANIFVTSQGQAKILDFGLAKLAGDATVGEGGSRRYPPEDGAHGSRREGDPPVTPDPFISLTGVAVGTAGYMSPEQARGEKLDARTDLFSFGLVLYEMATGQRAFKGDTGPVLHDAILNQLAPPARQLNPNLPPKLEKIIHRALEKDREARYQSADEMRANLRDLREEREPKHGAGRWAITAAVVAVLFIGIVILWFAKLRPASRQSSPEPRLRQLTTNSFENRVTSGAISPNGKYLAYSDTKGIYVKQIESGETRAVPQPEEFKDRKVGWECGFWFPDSTRFVANAHLSGIDPGQWDSQGSSIWVASVLGEASRKLRDNAAASSVSPDGSWIGFGTHKGKFGDREIWLMGPNGDQARKLFDTDADSAIGGLSWSPDGKRVMYLRTNPSGDTLLSRDLSGGSSVTIFGPNEMKQVHDFFWLGDGRLLYSVAESELNASCNLWEMRLDGRTGEAMEKPRQLTNWSGFCTNGLSETSDGKKLAFLKWTSKQTSFLADLASGGSRILKQKHFPLSESSEGVVDWTSDSKAIFFISFRSGSHGIFRQFLDQDIAEPVVTEGYGRDPRVTPDGKSILYLGPTENGAPPATTPQPVMRVSIARGPSQMLFISTAWSLLSCARSPSKLCVIGELTEDGKQLAVSVLDPVQGRGAELFRFALVANDNTWFLDLSPDGTCVAVTRTSGGPIYILSLDGRILQEIRVKGWSNLLSLIWAADGKGLFVSAGIRNGRDILHVDLQGNAQVLWENTGGSGETLAHPSPDGRHLAFDGWTTSGNMWIMENF